MAKQEKNQQAQTEHSQAGAVIEMLTAVSYTHLTLPTILRV